MKLHSSLLIMAVAGMFVSDCHEEPREPKIAIYDNSRCDGTPQDWRAQGAEFGELMAHNLLEVGPQRIRWNQVPISDATLHQYLAVVHDLNPVPALVVVFDSQTACDVVRNMRTQIEASMHCQEPGRVCVEYSAGEWSRLKPPPPR